MAVTVAAEDGSGWHWQQRMGLAAVDGSGWQWQQRMAVAGSGWQWQQRMAVDGIGSRGWQWMAVAAEDGSGSRGCFVGIVVECIGLARHCHNVYDRMYGDFPAKITVHTPYIPINVWFWPTLGMHAVVL